MRQRVERTWQAVTFVSLALMFVFLAACSGQENQYSEYQFIDNSEWNYGDTLTFLPCHSDSLISCNAVVSIRHDGSFPFTEAAIELTVGNLRDTLMLSLADNSGKWIGQGIGTNFQVSDTLRRRFIHPSGLPITLRQVLRADTLRGIDRIGIFLVNSRPHKL